MILSPAAMLKRIHDTKAVSIWNHQTGPIFWYAASVPGPFYVNTELVIGKDLSASLLKQITAIVAETPTAAERAQKLETMIMDAYNADATFQNIIETMVAKTKESFSTDSFSLISGGERRDWLFSIPMAKLMGLRHVYLFKNGDFYCEKPLKMGEVALHVADLINNAASYFDAWLPILEKAGLACVGTVSVNVRGNIGTDRLKANGQKVVTLNTIDTGFFEQSQADGLIDAKTLEEIRLFFKGAPEWAAAYLMDKPALFNASGIDAKSFERLETFFTKDPWGLKGTHAAFFEAMHAAIDKRKAQKA
ncbi:MAG: hypothetical protein WC612_08145 [Bdellovibrionales bacterium]|jgi:orotate phosphoribosyltransferase